MSSMIINAPRFGEQLVCWPAGNFSSTTSTYYSTSGLEIDFGVQASGVSAIPPNQRVRFQSSLGGRANSAVIVSDFGAATSLPAAGTVTASWGAPACFNAATETLEWWIEVDCGDSVLPSANSIATTSGTTQQVTIDHATAGQQCTSTTYYYYDMEDCADGTTFVGRSTTSGLSVGDSYTYGLISDPDCGTITGTNSTATSGSDLHTNYTDCCGCMEANKCRGTSGFSTPTTGSGTYASGNYEHVISVQITPLPGYPSGYVINEYTKVTVEADLGGRSAASVVLSDFGTSTSTYAGPATATLYHAYDDSSNQCFTSATETLRWRLKVECGTWNGSAITSCSSAYTTWQSSTVDHATAGEQCSSGGSNFQVTDCNSGATAIIDDSGGYGISVGDFVDWYDNSGNGPFCAEVTASSSGTATGSAYGGTYTDCANCNSTNYLTLYEVTDCNSSTTYILDDSGGYAPTTGDIVYFSDSSGNDVCATVTTVGASGTAVGTISSTYSDCSSCNSDYGLGGGGGGGGSNFTVVDCNDSSNVVVLNDAYGISPSIGSIAEWMDPSTYNYHCGTITGTTSDSEIGPIENNYEFCSDC